MELPVEKYELVRAPRMVPAARCIACSIAVLFVDLTVYRAYRPLALGLRGKLARLDEPRVIWTFDNVYEELGVPKSFLNAGYGLLGMRGVPRPSFHAFELLHKLGETQLETGDGPVLATRRKDGSLAILVWNLMPQPPGQRSASGDPMLQTSAQYEHKGEAQNLVLALEGGHSHRRERITRVDENSGNLARAYERMDSPAYPTVDQIAALKRKSELAPPESVSLNAQKQIEIAVPPNARLLSERL